MEIKNIKRTVQISFGIILILSLLQIGPFKPMIDEVSAESSWVQTTDLDFYNGTLNNLTILGSGEDAELRLILNNWWTNKTLPNRPSPRKGHAMAAVYGTDKIILFGGIDNNDYCNDTWVYDLSNNSWTEKYPIINPGKKQLHSMATVYHDDKVVLFDGSNDIWIYDLGMNSWTKKVSTNKPSARDSIAIATFYGIDKILLFGGWDGSWENYNDTWIYDVSENKWTNVTLPVKPGARFDHSIAAIQGTDKILLFGGFYNKAPTRIVYNDTWVFDLSDKTWTKVFYYPHPNHRYGHAMATVYGSDKVLLFGGREWMSNMFKNDTWIYKHKLIPKNGTYVSGPYDIEYNSSFKTISWNDLTPKNTSIEFQLRTANNESNLFSKPFVGPDGTASTFYATPPSDIWSGHDGDSWVQYKAYFIMNNFTNSLTLKDVTITYNCLPEIEAIGPLNGSQLSNNKPTFTWTFMDVDSEEQKAFQL
ncbi:MAG: hypothetical protein KAJ51_01405, partial [Thermoplasmata archaeon]|nr:hypothetical protein [Thermoplasmata archaeon]